MKGSKKTSKEKYTGKTVKKNGTSEANKGNKKASKDKNSKLALPVSNKANKETGARKKKE